MSTKKSLDSTTRVAHNVDMSETTTTQQADRAICETMLAQLGRMNLLAISGGRLKRIGEVTLDLPVHYGYSVEIEYDRGRDLYNVRRIFTRSRKRTNKGEALGVYAEELGEMAYQASCYRDEFGA